MQNAYFPIIFDMGIKQSEMGEEEPKALACLTEHDWKLLAEHSRLVNYNNNEVILGKGELPKAIYIVEEGRVRIEGALGNVIARRGAGAVFGEISFVESKGASASVVADGEASISVIDKGHVEKLLDTNSDFAIRFYKTLASTMAFRLRQAAESLSGQS